MKQAFLYKSSVYCTLIIAQHFQRKIHKEKKKMCAEWRKDEIVDNIKVSIRKDHNIEVVNRFFKNTFVQVKQNNDASGIRPKKS